jgi:hypothetical protein
LAASFWLGRRHRSRCARRRAGGPAARRGGAGERAERGDQLVHVGEPLRGVERERLGDDRAALAARDGLTPRDVPVGHVLVLSCGSSGLR